MASRATVGAKLLSAIPALSVIPAQAGIQGVAAVPYPGTLDSRLRGNDDGLVLFLHKARLCPREQLSRNVRSANILAISRQTRRRRTSGPPPLGSVPFLLGPSCLEAQSRYHTQRRRALQTANRGLMGFSLPEQAGRLAAKDPVQGHLMPFTAHFCEELTLFVTHEVDNAGEMWFP